MGIHLTFYASRLHRSVGYFLYLFDIRLKTLFLFQLLQLYKWTFKIDLLQSKISEFMM